MSGDAKEAFSRMAAKDATIRREGLPDPAKVAGSGIKTKESLAWLEAERPSVPSPEYTGDDEQLRDAANENARAERLERINGMRRRLVGRARKGRDDFETAGNYRGDAPER
ncbi:MAG: hypothetical protein KDK08_23145 [Rhizobiaceae bacterium]|nr:hypothetical protein [Rhizobiaceae bacterium]